MRVFIAVAPFGCSIAVGALLVRLLPAPTSLADQVLATLLVATGSLLAYVVPQRAGRRLLPLAALLDLTLAFPDITPSRFGVALRAQSARRIKDQLSRSLEGGPPVSRRPGAPAGQAAADLVGLLAALTLHDPQVRGHSERVRAYTAVIAAELHLEDGARNRLAWAALLHDVGKIAVPREVLRKVTPLTKEEWTLVRAHTVIGDRLIHPLADWLGEYALVPLQHHERWDGTGYPRGLIGEQISPGARIVAVADAFDVMTSVRSYHRSLDPEAARRELVACSGQQFDPAVVRAFLNAGLRPVGGRAAALVPVGALTTLLDALQVRLRLLPPSGAFAAAGSAVVAAGLSGLLPVRVHPVEAVAPSVTQPVAAAEPASPGNQLQSRDPFAPTMGEAQMDAVPVGVTAGSPTPSSSTGSKSPAALPISPAPGTVPAANPPLTAPSETPVAPLAPPAVNVPPVALPPLGLPPVGVPAISVPPAVVAIPQLSALSLPGLSVAPVLVPGPVSLAVPMSQPVTLGAPADPPPSATAVSVPPVSVPPVSVPPVSVPPVSVPPVSVPPISVPAVIAPPVTAPPATLPPASLPPSLPPASLPTTLPLVSTPVVTAPPPTLPPVSAPPATVPPSSSTPAPAVSASTALPQLPAR